MIKFFGKKINKVIILNFIMIVFFLGLPYYLFGGKFYIGGDDTRLFYSFPIAYLSNVTFFSWYNVSTIGINVSNQYLFPFLVLWIGLSFIITNKIILSYFAFSLPLIVGFIFFQKFVQEIFDFKEKHSVEAFLASFFFILSPILIINQYFIFLTTMWLLALIPVLSYFFVRYLKTNTFLYVFFAALSCLIFSPALFSVPWILGYVLPLGCGLLVLAFFNTRVTIIHFIRRLVIFAVYILLAQAFWLANFVAPFFSSDQNSFVLKYVSKGFQDTFTPTVLSTATGTIIYPLLNLFYRQIPFDFGWDLKNIFLHFFDKTIFFDGIFLFVFFFGLFTYKKFLSEQNKRIFLFLLTALFVSLFLFTVNIGPLKNLFLLFGKIPGFVMFRNFYDKFAMGFVMIYSMIIFASLVLIKKKNTTVSRFIFLGVFFVLLLNFTTVKATVNSPLWTTKSTYKVITIPQEYLSFMNSIKEKISPTNTIFMVPFGSSVYSVIKDVNTNNIYLGVSPVKIFSGVNDISGHYSFNFSDEANTIDGDIINRNYKKLQHIFYEHDINYVMITKNIPNEVKGSYAYDLGLLSKQDGKFLHAILGKKILRSSRGNYELYTATSKNILIQSPGLYFERINPTEYTLYLKGLKKSQKLIFYDSYNGGWKLFLDQHPNLQFCKKIIDSLNGSSECKSEFQYLTGNELMYLFQEPIFDSSHTSPDGLSNIWTINPDSIKKNFDSRYYSVNKDGSMNVMITMYFKPQSNFYLGSIISILVFLGGAIYGLKQKLTHDKAKKK